MNDSDERLRRTTQTLKIAVACAQGPTTTFAIEFKKRCNTDCNRCNTDCNRLQQEQHGLQQAPTAMSSTLTASVQHRLQQL